MRTLILLASTALTLSLATSALGDTLVVANKSDASVWLLDPMTGEVRAKVEVGLGPHEIAMSPDGRFAVVSNYGDGARPGRSLSVVDVVQARVHRGIDLAGHERPHGMQFLDDRRLLVTSETSQALLTVDVGTGEILESRDTQARVSHMVVLSPLKERAHVSNIADGSMTTLTLERGPYWVETGAGAGSEGIDVSADRRWIWVANRADNTVTVIDAWTLDVVDTIMTGDFPIRVRFAPDSRHAVVTNARGGDAWIYDVEDREVVAVVDLGEPDGSEGPRSIPVGVLVDPTGREAYVALSGRDELAVIDLRTLRVKRRLQAGGQPDGMGWSDRDVKMRLRHPSYREELLARRLVESDEQAVGL